MVVAAAAAHGVFIEHAQSGDGLARIQDARLGAVNGVHELAGIGGDPAQPLQKIEDDALAAEQRARVVAHHGDGLAFVQAHAVKDLAVADHFRMADGILVKLLVNLQDAGHGADAGKNAILLGQNGGDGALPGIDAGARGGVAGGLIFQQRVFQKSADSSTVPVHS
jgi:hypothetical protein